ncbi:MAG TPA: YfiR family protein, partial [Blastocatellia bacterium]
MNIGANNHMRNAEAPPDQSGRRDVCSVPEILAPHVAGAIAVSFVLAGMFGPPVYGQSQGEYPVKAAFLYNFAKFVEWPGEALGDPGTPLILGVIGDDPFGQAIDQLVASKTASGRRIMVRRFKWGQDVRQCHILFISSSE